ncbi:MAG TPA: TetR/AcrR family transcriptional regulator [Rhizomicrobium sp.]|jgi:AcrR family transcriptional regulator
MASAKPDRRIARTRQALMSAFVGEILARGYEAVSVEDIARRADVGRSTFYMHYKSKDDLLRESISRPSAILSMIVGGDVTVVMLVPQLVHFYEQRVRGASFFRDPIRRLWVNRLAEMIEPRLAKVARHTQAQPHLPLQLTALQLAEAQIALISGWLLEKPALKPEAVAEAMIASTQGMLRSLLGLRPEVSVLIPGEKLRVVHQSA